VYRVTRWLTERTRCRLAAVLLAMGSLVSPSRGSCDWLQELIYPTREILTLGKQTNLSLKHTVFATSITRAENGDYIVVGSDSPNEHTPWAIRYGSAVRWEFFSDRSDLDKSRPFENNRISDGLDLGGEVTLLCGTRKNEDKQAAFISVIGADRKVETINFKSANHESTSITKCLKWNGGIALLGSAGDGSNNGWLIMVDAAGHTQSLTRNEDFRALDALETADHDLVILTHQRVVRVNGAHEIVARYDVPASSPILIHPVVPSDTVQIGVMEDTYKTEFIDLDRNLHEKSRVTAKNVGLQKGYALADHSLVIFGSTFSGYATANVARIYSDRSKRNFALNPLHAAGWVQSAAPLNPPRDFVMVTNLNNGQTIVSEISIVPK
jgi:hypothetical protein